MVLFPSGNQDVGIWTEISLWKKMAVLDAHTSPLFYYTAVAGKGVNTARH